MKRIISLIFIFFVCTFIAKSAEGVSHFYGDCFSNDSLKSYGAINYLRMGNINLGSSTWTGPSVPDSIPVTSTLASMCDYDIKSHAPDPMRMYYKPFRNIVNGSSTYNLDENEIEIDLIYTVSSESDSLYVFELKDKSTGIPIAIDYGSDNIKTYPNSSTVNRLSYLVILDNNDSFESHYNEENLFYKEIFNFGYSYLYEIRDKTNENKLIGFKYLSQKISKSFIKLL